MFKRKQFIEATWDGADELSFGNMDRKLSF